MTEKIGIKCSKWAIGPKTFELALFFFKYTFALNRFTNNFAQIICNHLKAINNRRCPLPRKPLPRIPLPRIPLPRIPLPRMPLPRNPLPRTQYPVSHYPESHNPVPITPYPLPRIPLPRIPKLSR